MKKILITTAIAGCLLVIVSAAALAADIGAEKGIDGPPRVEFTGPPELVAIPGRYVYFVPDTDVDIFFYHDWWYRPYGRHWFRSDNYSGPWEHTRRVPHVLLDLPAEYRTTPPGYSRVPYDELRNNWQRWEREKYWEKREEETKMKEQEEEKEKEERNDQPEGDGDSYQEDELGNMLADACPSIDIIKPSLRYPLQMA
jgi:hypothetical protein